MRFREMFRYYHKEKTGLQNAMLTGPVQQLMLTSYYPILENGLVKEGRLVEDQQSHYDLNHILRFDEQGMLTEERKYGVPGACDVQLYGIHGVTDHWSETDGVRKDHYHYTYDERGNAVFVEKLGATGNNPLTHTTTFDEKNRPLKKVTDYKDIPKASNVELYTYDDATLTTHYEKWNLEGTTLLQKRKMVRNEAGHMVVDVIESFEKQEGVLNWHKEYVFNEHNDMVGWDHYRLDGTLVESKRFVYRYDGQGKRIVEPNNEHEVKVTFQDLTDHHGNWTWRAAFEDGVPKFVMQRTINYYGQAEQELIHPLSVAKEKEDTTHRQVKRYGMPEMNSDDIKFIYGQDNLQPGQFPTVRYYVSKFHYPPTYHVFQGQIEAMAVLQQSIDRFGAQVVFKASSHNRGWSNLNYYVLEFPMYYGYMLVARQIQQLDDDQFIVPDEVPDRHEGSVRVSSFDFFTPPEGSENVSDYFEDMVNDMMDTLLLKKRPELPKINLIEVRGTSYAMVERPVHDNFTIRDLDINYGQGFGQFHSDLIKRFNTTSKGLVLFHGVPGTGKTYYIRHLLRAMALNCKTVIYMPPNMVDHLTDPAFMTFLAQSVQNWSVEGLYCVLLIEDAEPLLAKRQEGVRIQGVTNLLNMTDGLLNDMLNLQIICTFNVDLRKLDSALLRPGRLLARKEFKPLSVLDANLLGQRLGIKHHFTRPASLGEIYAMVQDAQTLIHDVDPNKDASTSIDDLL